ncbi:Maf family protein [Halomonas sp. Bachu 37]|uniref:Maf family protein n=1 Tax=Halomonas kashgarensis TaxID=3084920 RepID=UPI0032168D05
MLSFPTVSSPTLCLASASPRRRMLLESIGVKVVVQSCDIDETPASGELPTGYVTRLARAKADAARHVDLPTLGSDTAIVLDGEILGKPRDAAHAAVMLRALSGRTHEVLTGVAVHGSRGDFYACVTTQVEMRDLSDREIAAYWGTGEPEGKAGGYAIQGLAAVFIKRIVGSYSAVVGLPLYETAELLRQHDVPLWSGIWTPDLLDDT